MKFTKLFLKTPKYNKGRCQKHLEGGLKKFFGGDKKFSPRFGGGDKKLSKTCLKWGDKVQTQTFSLLY